MKKMKSALSLLLALMLALTCFAVPVFAEDDREFLYLEAVESPSELSSVISRQAEELLLAANSGNLSYSISEYSIGNPFQIYEDETLSKKSDVYYYPVICQDKIMGLISGIYCDENISLYYSRSFADKLNEVKNTSMQTPAILYYDNGNIVALTAHESLIISEDIENKQLNHSASIYPQYVEGYDIMSSAYEIIPSNTTRALSRYIDLDIQETQGDYPDCAAYVATTIIRTVTGDSVYVSDMYNYFNKSLGDSFSRTECQKLGEEYGLSPKIKRLSRLSDAATRTEIDEGRPMYLGCNGVNCSGSHAICLRGYIGNTYSVWNPWYPDYGSMWISSPFGDEDYIYTAENGHKYVWHDTIYNWG